jgi:AraC-like DNA-binding protein
LSRGVHQRTIYQHAIRSHPPTIEYIRKIVMSGGEVRTLDELTDRLIICDRSVAFMPISGYRADEALEIRNAAVVRFLLGTFESAWKRAQPVATGYHQVRPANVADDIERAIMRFLVGGHTEATIARQLGMSQRTVATHIRRISDRLGSTSRGQLGYLIGVRNLLDD